MIIYVTLVPSSKSLTLPDLEISRKSSSVYSLVLISDFSFSSSTIFNLIFPRKFRSIVSVRVAVSVDSSVDSSGLSEESVEELDSVESLVLESVVSEGTSATIELSAVCVRLIVANAGCVDNKVGAISQDAASRRIVVFFFITKYSFSFSTVALIKLHLFCQLLDFVNKVNHDSRIKNK